MSELIGKVLGNYHLLEHIGRGGMASVYKALDLKSEQPVAVKILSPQLAVEVNFKARFEREAEVLRGLEHPSIVPILDYGEEGGLTFIVMPFMPIGTLSDLLSNGGVTLYQCARIIEQVSEALQHAHDLGVVHRDVKPSNVLIDEDGNAWLSDFGFAHIHDATLSLTGSALIGTPAYMAPEIVSGGRITPKSDQYSLAVVLYHLCTGHLPYDAEAPMAIAIRHVNSPLPNPRSFNPSLPRSIELVLLKALEKDESLRFDSVQDFNRALQAAVEVEGEREERRQGSFFDRTLVTLESVQAEVKFVLRSPRYLKRTVLIGAFLLMMAFPVAASSVFKVPDGVRRGEVAAGDLSAENLQATIDALYTANAPGMGTPWNSGDIATSVAQTLSAMETLNGIAALDSIPMDLATSTPTSREDIPLALTGTANNLPTTTPTVRWVYKSPTPTSSSHSSGGEPPQPTSTLSPTPTPTMDDSMSPTPIPPTAEPSVTSIPSTPAPTRTLKCNPKKTPPHPRACPSSAGEQDANLDD